MKKLTQEKVCKIFEDYGCKLLSLYTSCAAPLDYKCRCGKVGSISLDKFKRRIKRQEGCKYCLHHEWTAEEDQILRNLYGNEPRNVISEALGVSLAAVKSRAQYLGLQGNSGAVNTKARSGKGRKYSFDDDFFSKKSLVACYWAGYLAAVGSIVLQKSTVQISLNKEVKKHLEQFQDVSCHTGVIHELKNDKLLLQFHSASKWIKDLNQNFGITSQKSNLQPPFKLSEKESLAFIVGYIDGKGLFRHKEQKFGFEMEIKGSQGLLLWIKSWFDKWYPPLSKKVLDTVKVRKFLFKYEIQGVRVKYIIEKLLSLKLPRLANKWNFI